MIRHLNDYLKKSLNQSYKNNEIEKIFYIFLENNKQLKSNPFFNMLIYKIESESSLSETHIYCVFLAWISGLLQINLDDEVKNIFQLFANKINEQKIEKMISMFEDWFYNLI